MTIICVVLRIGHKRYYIALPAVQRGLNGKSRRVLHLYGNAYCTMISAVLSVRRQLRARYMQQWNRRIDADVIRLPVGVCS